MKIWKTLKKIFKIKHLIGLILLLVANSLAWFIYATRVDNRMDVHVRAWNVLFQAGDSPITDYIDVSVDSMYPGMEDFVYEIKASNHSEVSAQVTYTLLEVNILGESQITVEGKQENKEPVLGTEYTSVELLEILENDYPFSINVTLNKEELDADFDEAIYQITIAWPFESGDDVADTLWGTRAASYQSTNPDDPTISLKIKIFISQTTE